MPPYFNDHPTTMLPLSYLRLTAMTPSIQKKTNSLAKRGCYWVTARTWSFALSWQALLKMLRPVLCKAGSICELQCPLWMLFFELFPSTRAWKTMIAPRKEAMGKNRGVEKGRSVYRGHPGGACFVLIVAWLVLLDVPEALVSSSRMMHC